MPLLSASKILNRSNFAAKYQDPRWEQRRAAYFSRNASFCRSCKRSGISLQLNHLAYAPDKELWDYSDDEFTCLCQDCHKRWHQLITAFRLKIASRMSVHDLQILLGAFSVLVDLYKPADVAMAAAQLAAEPNTIRRLKLSWENSK